MNYTATHNTDDNGLWEWKGDDYYLQKDCHLDIPHSIWEGDQNEQLSSYMFDTTPVKEVGDGDLPCNLSFSSQNNNPHKQEEEQFKVYSSRTKRRRMLQFNTHSTDTLLCDENTQYAFQNLKDKEDLMHTVPSENTQWESGLCGGLSVSGSGGLDGPSEAWLSNCFNDDGMHISSDDMNFSGLSDDQIDISEFCNITDEMESDTINVCPTPPPKIIYKGRKSYIRTPTNLASSVAYPFALIKPCGVHGDVTLKDINQRILNPVLSAPKQDEYENPSAAYPTSAFSGKPVVVKTKIRTEGGKGSITIMRTKG